MKNALSLLAWMATSILTSELLGYLLHRLLHSGKIGFLSRSHMKHHLVLYGPLQPQRPSPGYHDATTGEIALGNVGLEWLIPGIIVLASSVALLHLLGVARRYQIAFVGTSLAWSFLMFSYLHDRMHVAGFWMERSRWLKFWFVGARRSHDIHHWALNDQGLMDKNFGIGFFFFDRLFGTHTREWRGFNQRGYGAALRRFGDLVGTDEGPISHFGDGNAGEGQSPPAWSGKSHASASCRRCAESCVSKASLRNAESA
ncbi:MAG TPA: sterol desaturase family protein [Terriglobales bacterium]|nr:sterol desaturase family protein [Terriglobales bacterium]